MTVIILDQGSDEALTLDIDGTEDLSGATGRLVAVANGRTVLDLALPIIAETRQTEIIIPAAISSAWNLSAWGAANWTSTESGYTGTGKRADFQVEILLNTGKTKRLDLGESYFIVVPELVR